MLSTRTEPIELSRYFRISSRSHHGLVFVTEIAKVTASKRPVSIRTIANAVGISEGYLEEIAACLRASGIIRGSRGRGGGYVLAKEADAITMGEIVRALDGAVVFAHCQDPEAKGPCPSEPTCASRRFFGRLKSAIDRELDGVTLHELTTGAISV